MHNESDAFRDKCGVFGIINSKNASYLTVLGLHALQHRGQESAGIISSGLDKSDFQIIKHHGIVNQTFSPEDISKLSGTSAIGHVRYSTSGAKDDLGIQPFYAKIYHGQIALAHNGNLTNYLELRDELTKNGAIFSTTIDTEVIIHLIAQSKKETLKEKIFETFSKIKGAFSIVILTEDFLCATRDPNGIRPLSIGETPDGSIVFTSETCSFWQVGAKFVRNIEPGEFVFVDKNTMKQESIIPHEKQSNKFCIFEYIYFARPDSTLEGKNVYQVRKKIGEILAKTAPVDADLVVPVPDSGIPAAIGYSQYSKIPFDLGIIRSHYIGRTFIKPEQKNRETSVIAKHSPNVELIKGKKIILIDDSIVRGTTSKKLVQMMFEAGASEVHMRISSPPTKFPCFYGIDTPNKKELIANSHSIEEIRKYLGATSLEYLSLESLHMALSNEKTFCDACFTGNYFV